MQIEFVESVKIGHLNFEKGLILSEDKNIKITDLNEKIVMVIINDIRYDIPKQYIKNLKREG